MSREKLRVWRRRGQGLLSIKTTCCCVLLMSGMRRKDIKSWWWGIMRDREKEGGRKKDEADWGGGGLWQHFLANILWKRRSKGGRRVGKILGRGSAGVVPPDLHWATKLHLGDTSFLCPSSAKFCSFLFSCCLICCCAVTSHVYIHLLVLSLYLVYHYSLLCCCFIVNTLRTALRTVIFVYSTYHL